MEYNSLPGVPTNIIQYQHTGKCYHTLVIALPGRPENIMLKTPSNYSILLFPSD